MSFLNITKPKKQKPYLNLDSYTKFQTTDITNNQLKNDLINPLRYKKDLILPLNLKPIKYVYSSTILKNPIKNKTNNIDISYLKPEKIENVDTTELERKIVDNENPQQRDSMLEILNYHKEKKGKTIYNLQKYKALLDKWTYITEHGINEGTLSEYGITRPTLEDAKKNHYNLNVETLIHRLGTKNIRNNEAQRVLRVIYNSLNPLQQATPEDTIIIDRDGVLVIEQEEHLREEVGREEKREEGRRNLRDMDDELIHTIIISLRDKIVNLSLRIDGRINYTRGRRNELETYCQIFFYLFNTQVERMRRFPEFDELQRIHDILNEKIQIVWTEPRINDALYEYMTENALL